MPFVYAHSNKYRGIIYIGVTSNLPQRVFDHKEKTIEGFSKTYNLTKLVWYEEYPTIIEAIIAEKRYKNWHREWKINLIEEINPNWNDLLLT